MRSTYYYHDTLSNVNYLCSSSNKHAAVLSTSFQQRPPRIRGVKCHHYDPHHHLRHFSRNYAICCVLHLVVARRTSYLISQDFVQSFSCVSRIVYLVLTHHRTNSTDPYLEGLGQVKMVLYAEN